MQLCINIDVHDLDAAIAFYTAAVGLTLARRLFGGTVAEMAGAAVPIQLLAKPAASAAVPGQTFERDYARHWTPVHLDFCVDNLDIALTRALGAGAVLEGAPHAHSWGRIATFSDPFGHGFCLMQLAADGYDSAAQ